VFPRAPTRAVLGLSILLGLIPLAQGSVETLRKHVVALDQDRPEGRRAESDGERRVADYLVRELEALGAVPLAGASSYVHDVEFASGADDLDSTSAAEGDQRIGRNVIGVLLPGKTDAVVGRARRSIVLGAAYERRGRDDAPAIGVAAVLDAAARLAARPLRTPVVLTFWAGESGAAGARDFVESVPAPGERIAAYLGLERVGPVRDNRLELRGSGSSSVWPRFIEQTNVVVGFDVQTPAEPGPPSAASVLHRAGVPSLSFLTGEPRPHRPPEDPSDTLDYAELDRVCRFASMIARKLDHLEGPPDYAAVEDRRPSRDHPAGAGPFTGTVPDYAAGVEGLRLSDVIDGGPAERAGLRQGDVIIEFAGHEIAHVHDYSEALGTVEIGRPVTVVYLRNGERQTTVITPTARP
jgi:hypothetical protein